jgi:hypothetical protein
LEDPCLTINEQMYFYLIKRKILKMNA